MKNIKYIFFTIFTYKTLSMGSSPIEPLKNDLQITQDNNLSKCPITRIIFFNQLIKNTRVKNFGFQHSNKYQSLKFIIDSLSYYHDEPDKIENAIRTLHYYNSSIYNRNYTNLVSFIRSLSKPKNQKAQIDSNRLEKRQKKYKPILDIAIKLKENFKKELNLNSKILDAYKPKQMLTEDEIVKLFKQGAYVGIGNSGGNTPIHLAIRHNHLEAVKAAVEYANGRLDLQNNQDKTALDLAIEKNNWEAVKILLKNKCFQNKKDFALQRAAEKDCPYKICMSILQLGAKPTVYALKESLRSNLQLFKVLIKQTSHLKQEELGEVLAFASYLNNTEAIEIILQKKPDLNSKYSANYLENKTAINWAIINENLELVKLLHTIGANFEGESIGLAGTTRNKEILEYVLQNRSYIQSPTPNRDNPIHTIIRSSYINEDEKIENLKKVIKLNIDINEENKWGATPLDLAAYLGLEKVIDFLYEKGAKIKLNVDTNDPTAETVHEGQMGVHVYKTKIKLEIELQIKRLERNQKKEKMRQEVLEEIKKRDIKKTNSSSKRTKSN